MKLTDHDMVTGETTVSYLPDWDHDAYQIGAEVTHAGQTWASTASNPCPPTPHRQGNSGPLSSVLYDN